MTNHHQALTVQELYDEIPNGRATITNDSKCVEEQLTNEQYLNRLDRRRYEVNQRF